MAALMSDLKATVSQKRSQIESNLVSSKINSVRNHYQPRVPGGSTFLENLESAVGNRSPYIGESISSDATKNSGDAIRLFDENLRKEVAAMKKK